MLSLARPVHGAPRASGHRPGILAGYVFVQRKSPAPSHGLTFGWLKHQSPVNGAETRKGFACGYSTRRKRRAEYRFAHRP